jgi:outer membrane immunogenic protein
MTYVTGGVAWAEVKTDFNETIGGIPGPVSFSDTRTGWTIGSGVEAAIAGNWTGKLEYLYVDLGSITKSFTAAGFPQIWSANLRNHVYRAGINYRLSGAGAGATVPPPTMSWAGFYLGGNAGVGLGRNSTTTNVATTIPPTVFYTEQINLAPLGVIGGVQAGYNWQSGNFVVGVEVDVQLAGEKDSQTCATSCVPLAGNFTFIEQKLTWFGTARGRLGYAAGPALFYATGGLAYGRVSEHVVHTGASFALVTGTFDFTHTKAGWTVGAGIERVVELLGPGWTARAEYLYIDLGRVTDSFSVAGLPSTLDIDLRNHVWRGALSYKFGGPVVAKY